MTNLVNFIDIFRHMKYGWTTIVCMLIKRKHKTRFENA